MSTIATAAYVLVARGKVLLSGDDPITLLTILDLSTMPDARVKSWRSHSWVDGIPGSVHNTPHCEACKRIRQSNGGNDLTPCIYPERIDHTVKIYNLLHEHHDDVCCPEHGHHVTSNHPHVNCFLR